MQKLPNPKEQGKDFSRAHAPGECPACDEGRFISAVDEARVRLATAPDDTARKVAARHLEDALAALVGHTVMREYFPAVKLQIVQVRS